MNTQTLADMILETHKFLDPQQQSLVWPNPIAWDGRPLDEQARDLCALLDARDDDAEAERLSSALWSAAKAY